jgi:hypothetical protein
MDRFLSVSAVFMIITCWASCKKDAPQPASAAKGEEAALVNSGDLKIEAMPSNPDSKPFTDENLRVEITSAGKFKADELVLIRMLIHNQGEKPASVCTVFTPFESRMRFRFDLTDSGGKVVEPTTQVKAGPKPMRHDYKPIEAGQAIEVVIDLRKHYELKPGQYTIGFNGNGFTNHLPDSKQHSFVVE